MYTHKSSYMHKSSFAPAAINSYRAPLPLAPWMAMKLAGLALEVLACC